MDAGNKVLYGSYPSRVSAAWKMAIICSRADPLSVDAHVPLFLGVPAGVISKCRDEVEEGISGMKWNANKVGSVALVAAALTLWIELPTGTLRGQTPAPVAQQTPPPATEAPRAAGPGGGRQRGGRANPSLQLYDAQCSGCHGGSDGTPRAAHRVYSTTSGWRPSPTTRSPSSCATEFRIPKCRASRPASSPINSCSN